MGLGLKMTIAMGIVLAVCLGGFYMYFQYAEGKMNEMAESLGKYEQALKTQEQSIKLLQTGIERANEAQRDLSVSISDIREETSQLGKIFARHDLGFLAARKPGLIERRINDGTKKAFDELERITDPAGATQ